MSRTQTKFIEAVSVGSLTEKVQEAEREGWAYVGMAMAALPLDTGSNIDSLTGPPILLVAAVRRDQEEEMSEDNIRAGLHVARVAAG